MNKDAEIVEALIEAIGSSRQELEQNSRAPEQMLALIRARLKDMRHAS